MKRFVPPVTAPIYPVLAALSLLIRRLDREQVAEYVSLRKKAFATLALGVVAMILSMPLMQSTESRGGDMDPLLMWLMARADRIFHPLIPALYEVPVQALNLMLLAMSLFVMLWAGRQYYVKAWSAFRHKSADMNTLIAPARARVPVLGGGDGRCHACSNRVACRRRSISRPWCSSSALVLAGNSMEARSRRRTAAAMRALAKLQPATARLERDGAEADGRAGGSAAGRRGRDPAGRRYPPTRWLWTE